MKTLGRTLIVLGIIALLYTSYNFGVTDVKLHKDEKGNTFMTGRKVWTGEYVTNGVTMFGPKWLYLFKYNK